MTDVIQAPATKIATRRTGALPVSSPMGWLRTEIDRLFDDFSGPGRSLFDFGPRVMRAPVPALELADREKEYRLTVELPGISEKDISISLTDGILTISGEKKEDQERKEDGYVVSERCYGSFKRQLTVPGDVDIDTITAKFKDGVLTVTLPKDEHARARSRKIEVAG